MDFLKRNSPEYWANTMNFLAGQGIINTVYIDEASATVTYYGFFDKGAVGTAAANCRIMKVEISGTVTSYLWADGDICYDNVWDDRATLTYENLK